MTTQQQMKKACFEHWKTLYFEAMAPQPPLQPLISPNLVNSLFKRCKSNRRQYNHTSAFIHLDHGLHLSLKPSKSSMFVLEVKTFYIDEFCLIQDEDEIEEIFNQFNNMKVEILDWLKDVNLSIRGLCFRYENDITLTDKKPYEFRDPLWTYKDRGRGIHELCFF